MKFGYQGHIRPVRNGESPGIGGSKKERKKPPGNLKTTKRDIMANCSDPRRHLYKDLGSDILTSKIFSGTVGSIWKCSWDSQEPWFHFEQQFPGALGFHSSIM